MTDKPKDDKRLKMKSFMRRYQREPLKEFTNFNLAQSTVRIVDNIGFHAAQPQALEFLARLMERYIEDMCKRIAFSKEKADRDVETIEDVAYAYQKMNISLAEFQDYVTQVNRIPMVPQMPLYPFKGFSSVETFKFPKQVFPRSIHSLYK